MFSEKTFLYVFNSPTNNRSTNNSIKHIGYTPILIFFVSVQPRNIKTKFEANPCQDLRVTYVISHTSSEI